MNFKVEPDTPDQSLTNPQLKVYLLTKPSL